LHPLNGIKQKQYAIETKYFPSGKKLIIFTSNKITKNNRSASNFQKKGVKKP